MNAEYEYEEELQNVVNYNGKVQLYEESFVFKKPHQVVHYSWSKPNPQAAGDSASPARQIIITDSGFAQL